MNLELMNWKEFLKPTWKKILFSFIITIAWILFLRFYISSGKYNCGVITSACYHYPAYLNYIILVPTPCVCNLTTSDAINGFLSAGVIPFILAYLLYSIISMLLSKKSHKT
jgi:hypothetical protein